MAPTQDKVAERAYYDELFARRGRFDQFDASVYQRLARTARERTEGIQAVDIGCGSGTQAVALAEHGFAVLALDLSWEAVRLTRQNCASEPNIDVICADAEHLPLPDRSVDACVCGLLLHHFKYLDPIADELARIVRPGGVVLTLDANAHNPFVWLFFNVIHRLRPLKRLTPNQRALRRGEIRRVFEDRGFDAFEFDAFSTNLRKDWLGGSLAAKLNFHARAAVLRISEIVLPRISQGNVLMGVFSKPKV